VAVTVCTQVLFAATDVGIKVTRLSRKPDPERDGRFCPRSSSGPGTFISTAYQIGNDLNLIRRNHQLTFGANLSQARTIARSNNVAVGTYAFNGTATGLGMADFVIGALTTLNQGSPTVWSGGKHTWRLMSRTLGRRRETSRQLWTPLGTIPAVIPDRRGNLLFSDDRFDKGIKSTVYSNGPAGMYFPGDAGFPKKSSIHTKLSYVAPRVGLAWDPRVTAAPQFARLTA